MPVTVAVWSYAHSVTYVTDNVLRSLKEIVRQSGLDPAKIADQWDVLHQGIKTWMESRHLERIVLEVYAPRTPDDALGRWDVEISYAYSDSDGLFWTDTDAIRYAILKAGVYPKDALYDIKVTTKPGRPAVAGWVTTTLRSTSGMIEQRIGTAIEARGLSGGLSYYRRP
jgi:hypothetical protein